MSKAPATSSRAATSSIPPNEQGGSARASLLLIVVGLALLIVGLPVSAKDPWTGHVVADSLIAQGNSAFVGSLVAFVEKGAPDINGIPPAVPQPGFSITADAIHIEVETSTEVDPPTGGLGLLPNTPPVPPTDLHHATLVGTSVGNDYRLAVYPRSTTRLPLFNTTAPCGRLDPANSTSHTEFPMAGPRDRNIINFPSGASLLWGSCGVGGEIEATGDFLISIWGWTVEGCGDEGCQDFESGPKAVADGVPEQGDVYRAQEIWVTASNARIEIPSIVAGVPHTLYAAPGSCLGGESLDFQSATALLEDVADQVFSAKQLTLLGDLTACGSIHDILATLGFDVTGTPTRILVDGQPMTWSSEISVAPSGWPYWWLLSLSALFLAVLVLADHIVPWHFLRSSEARDLDGFLYEETAGYRSRRALGYYIGAYVMGKRERPTLSLLFAWRTVRLTPNSVDAHLMRARLLAQSGRRRASLKEYEALDGLMPNNESRALNSIQVAETYLDAGSPQDAEKWLKRAHASSPATLASKLAEPGHQNLAAFAYKILG